MLDSDHHALPILPGREPTPKPFLRPVRDHPGAPLRLKHAVIQDVAYNSRAEEALGQIDKAAAIARETGSMKYVARSHALRGEAVLGAKQWRQAEAERAEALRIARGIGYATGIWQAAHLLSRAQAGQKKMEDAFASARLAAETVDAVAARVPDPALRQNFLNWSRVQAVREDLDRLRRG